MHCCNLVYKTWLICLFLTGYKKSLVLPNRDVNFFHCILTVTIDLMMRFYCEEQTIFYIGRNFTFVRTEVYHLAVSRQKCDDTGNFSRNTQAIINNCFYQNIYFFKSFYLTVVKKNRQNEEGRKKNGYLCEKTES